MASNITAFDELMQHIGKHKAVLVPLLGKEVVRELARINDSVCGKCGAKPAKYRCGCKESYCEKCFDPASVCGWAERTLRCVGVHCDKCKTTCTNCGIILCVSGAHEEETCYACEIKICDGCLSHCSRCGLHYCDTHGFKKSSLDEKCRNCADLEAEPDDPLRPYPHGGLKRLRLVE